MEGDTRSLLSQDDKRCSIHVTFAARGGSFVSGRPASRGNLRHAHLSKSNSSATSRSSARARTWPAPAEIRHRRCHDGHPQQFVTFLVSCGTLPVIQWRSCDARKGGLQRRVTNFRLSVRFGGVPRQLIDQRLESRNRPLWECTPIKRMRQVRLRSNGK